MAPIHYYLVLMLTVVTLAQEQNTKQTACENVLSRECEAKGNETLYLIAMAPYPVLEGQGPRPSWAGGPKVVPGALLAASHINCNSTILPDHVIKLVIADGGCNLGSKASSNFTSNLFYSQRKPVVGIVGGGCSESSFTVGSLVTRDEISLLQIAPSATSPLFVSDIMNYQNTFRVTVSAHGYINAFWEIIKYRGYKEVGILYEATRSYMVTVYNDLALTLQREGVKADKSFGLFPSYLVQPLTQLENKVRLIFVFAARGVARQVLCLAYRKNMLHPDYQFVFINRRPGDFLAEVSISRDGVELFSCNSSQMEVALSTATLFEFRVTRQDKHTQTVSGYTLEETECQYNKVVEEHEQLLNINSSVSTEFQNAYYDATWALAISLHMAMKVGVNLTNYTYGQPTVTKTIKEELFKVSFEGLSGKVTFSNQSQDGEEVTIIDVFQRPSNSVEFKPLGYYKPGNGLTLEDDAYFVERSVFDLNIAHPPSALGYFFIALSILVGLGIAVSHYLNGLWRGVKTMKATSPQLNHLIFSGCYLMLMNVVIYSVETTILVRSNLPNEVLYGVLCNAQKWVLALSFSLVFGTVCVKTWRVFRIFSHFSSTPIKYVDDSMLVGIVICLVFIDIAYLMAWNAVNPLVKVVNNEQPQVYRAVCLCDNQSYWLSFLIIYKVVLLGFVLYFSISTRHVNKPEFKQTKSINTLIYIIVIIMVFTIAPYVIIIASRTTDLLSIIVVYVTWSIGYILSAVMCALFVFLPLIHPALKKECKR